MFYSGILDSMAGEGINPFDFNHPARAHELINRRSELDVIMNLVWSGNNARLAAPRRYGKTSLLLAAEREADRKGFLPVHVDFYGALSDADIANKIGTAYAAALTGKARQVFSSVIRRLNPTFRIGGGTIPSSVELGVKANTPVLTELLEMPRRLHERSGQRLLIVFDEFQEVMNVGETASLIRSVIQHHGDIASYVFAGSDVGMMRALFGDKRRPFYTQAAPVPLPPLRPDDLIDYIGRKFDETGKDSAEGLEPVVDTAEGHPQRAMLLAYYLWDKTPLGGSATAETWADAFDAAILYAIDEFARAWDDSSVTLRRLLTVIADNGRRLYADDTGIRTGSGTTRALKTLIGRGDVVEDASKATRHRLVDPLLASWIRSGRPIPSPPDR
ncbi:MAG: AAA family ATPase [Acidimicrobiales bacterium]